MILGLVGNPNKTMLKAVLPPYVKWLEEHKIPHLIFDGFAHLEGIPRGKVVSPLEIAKQADILLSFGGDGTFLNSIHLLNGKETPVVGINLGGLGYLAEVSAEELYNRTEDILAKRWKTEHRMVLEARLEDGSCLSRGPWYALNDVVLDKGGYSRMIHLHTTIDGKFLNNYRADGLLISTPTGSTGYSLSAGGPIVEPKMRVIIVHPLNPHSLSNRPLIISDDKEIRVEATTPYDHVAIAVDGEIACKPSGNHILVVRRASFSACLLTFEGRLFYDVLRQKLGWGDE